MRLTLAKSFISIGLAVLVLLLLSLALAVADDGDSSAAATPTPEPTPQPVVEPSGWPVDPDSAAFPTEAVDRRTLYASHYQLDSHLYRAEISLTPRHYRTADGHWAEIDLQPVPRPEGGFKVEANNIRLGFPDHLAEAAVTVDGDLYFPSMQGESAVRQLTFNWQPLYLAYADASGSVTAEFQPTAGSGEVTTNGVLYRNLFDQTDLTVFVSRIGYGQRLRLLTWPAEGQSNVNSSPDRLVYAIALNLPDDLAIYGDGQLLTGDATATRLDLRDRSGATVLTWHPPQLKDQISGRALPSAWYRVEATAAGWRVQAEMPLGWLRDSARVYPVEVEFLATTPLGIVLNDAGLDQDTWIYECQSNTVQPDDLLIIGRNNIDCTPGRERALVRWALDSLPPTAMIARDAMEGPTHSLLYRRPGFDSGPGTLRIGTYRLFAAWQENSATWRSRQTGNLWTGAGAADDYLVVAEDFADIASASTGYVSMGSLSSLVGAWHTNRVYAGLSILDKTSWGVSNNGVIYIAEDELVGGALDRAFSQIDDPNGGNAPRLSITYFDDDFFDLTPAMAVSQSRAPSPDRYVMTTTNSWQAVAIRAFDGRSDYDLFISTTPILTSSLVTASVVAGDFPDFIVLEPGSPGQVYPWVFQWDGTEGYTITQATQAGQLQLTGAQTLTQLTGQIEPATIVKPYRVRLEQNRGYRLRVELTSGNADLGLGLFAPAAGSGAQITAHASALELADTNLAGQAEEFIVTAPATGWYGLVIWNNGATQLTNFRLSLQGNIIDPAYAQTMYLPLVGLNIEPILAPLANGGFETGTFDPWIDTDLEPPLVASIVNQPPPDVPADCFSGGRAAQLGTPGKLDPVPIGSTSFQQSFRLPADAQTLTFKYFVASYDILKGANSGRAYDRFEVTVNSQVKLIDGNPAGSTNGQTLWTSGCKTGSIDVSAYAGRNITLKFAVYNLIFKQFNTWAFVDDVQVP